MKFILIIALALSSKTTCINSKQKTRTVTMKDENRKMKMEDDSRTLIIKAKTRNTENPVDYNKIFDVRNMNEVQRKELENHILDSLGFEKIK